MLTIFHNPRCSKSRETLALLQQHGAALHVVDYLQTPPSEHHLAALLQLEGVEVLSVQKGEAVEQIKALTPGCRLRNLSPEIQSFEDTAAILSEVDELVTVDTSVAHLAGGLGCQVRVLLPLIPDWRWLLSRADSPWYPTARLYRQTARGAWAEPVAALVADVANAARAQRPETP